MDRHNAMIIAVPLLAQFVLKVIGAPGRWVLAVRPHSDRAHYGYPAPEQRVVVRSQG